MVTLQAVLPVLSNVRKSGDGYTARCPAHEDERNSLSLSERGGTLLWKCFAGCDQDTVRLALLELVNGHGANGHGNGPRVAEPRGHIVAEYSYHDERGELLYQAVRLKPKDFRQRRPDGRGGWTWNLGAVRRVVYHLNELPENRRVVLVEGEKDAERLHAEGLTATTWAGGADGWRAEYADQLRAALGEGAEIVCIPDNDAPGLAVMARAGRDCRARGLRTRTVRLTDVPDRGDVSDYLDAGHTVADLEALVATTPEDSAEAGTESQAKVGAAGSDYIQTVEAFLNEEDAPVEYLFPDLLPRGVIMLLHGDARARKSLAAFELALSAATGTVPFGLTRFAPAASVEVLYIQEEDPRSLARPRLRALIEHRCGGPKCPTLHVSIRRGVNLDDSACVARLTEDLKRLDARLLVLDAARRLSAKTDEGPAKVREFIAVLRSIVDATGVAIVIVHHDVKPNRDGQDNRRRSHRASGGDWFAGCECPVHVERTSDRDSLFYPQDYKFSADPAPFTFTCHVTAKLITHLTGTDTTTDRAERAGVCGKIVDWPRTNGPATKTAMKKAGLGRWETIEDALDTLLKEGKVDAGPGRTAGSLRYFVPGESSPARGTVGD